MTNKNYALFFPDEVGLGKRVDLGRNVDKKSKVKGIIENEVKVDGKVTPYSYLEHEGVISVMTYNKFNIDGYKEKFLVSVAEFCRTDYIKRKLKESAVYVFVSEKVIVVVREGEVRSYLKLREDSGLAELVKVIHDVMNGQQTRGHPPTLYMDEYIDSFDAEKSMIDFDVFLKAVEPTQLLANPNYKSFFVTMVDEFWSRKDGKRPVGIVLGSVAVFSLFVQNIFMSFSLSQMHDDIDKMKRLSTLQIQELSSTIGSTDEKLEVLSKSLDGINKEFVKINPEQLQQITQVLMSKDEGMSEARVTQLIQDLMAPASGGGLGSEVSAAEMASSSINKPFFCKTLIKEKKRVTCLYNGVKVTIDSKYKHLSDFEVRFNAHTKEYELRDGMGRFSITPLEVADRGF